MEIVPRSLQLLPSIPTDFCNNWVITIRILRKDQLFKFQLNEKYLEAMKGLKEKLCSPLVLALPSAERQRTLDRSAYNVQSGCELLQSQPYRLTKLIRYWLPVGSKTPTCTRYDAARISCNCIGRDTLHSVPRGHPIHNQDGS